MSATKPKVTFAGAWMFDDIEGLMYDYTWSCPCGATHPDPSDGEWSSVVASAMEHSRTHTAERIAEELERLSGDALDKAEQGSRYSGVAYAFAKSCVLIRTYLVKENS